MSIQILGRKRGQFWAFSGVGVKGGIVFVSVTKSQVYQAEKAFTTKHKHFNV